MDRDLVHALGFPILGCYGDFKHGITAAAAQVLPVDSVGGAFHRFPFKNHGGHFIGDREGVFKNIGREYRGERAVLGHKG